MKPSAIISMKISTFFLILLAITARAPTKSIVDASYPDYKKSSFNLDKITSLGIGIMPVMGSPAIGVSPRSMGEALFYHLEKKFGTSNVKSPQNVIDAITNENFNDEYYRFLKEYQTSGIIPKDIIYKLGQVLDANYLLYTRLLSDSEVSKMYSRYNPNITWIENIYIYCQVWEVTSGEIVWKGIGGASKLQENPSYLVEKTAEGMSQIFGLETDNSPSEDQGDLIEAMRKAKRKTLWLALSSGIGGGILLGFTLVLFM